MRITNFSFVPLLVLFSLDISSGMAIKGVGSGPENSRDCSGETTQTPEAGSVRGKKPETDSVNDATEPQLLEDFKGQDTPDMPIAKRCARVGSPRVGSPRVLNGEPILSLTRRDLFTERRVQQCEACKNRALCKNRKICGHCKAICNGIETTDEGDQNGISSSRPEEKREITEAPPETLKAEEPVILTSRFVGSERKDLPVYYSLAFVERGSEMSLLAKMFDIPKSFDKLIILGKMNGDEGSFKNITIVDLAQTFGNGKSVEATVTRSDTVSSSFINNVNTEIEERMRQTGSDPLDKEEVDEIIDKSFKEVSNVGSAQKATTPAPETETRCDMDEAVEDLINVLPHNSEPYNNYNHPQEKAQVYHQVEASSEEEIKNPPVIQDSYDARKSDTKDKVGDSQLDYVDDNEESRPEVISEFKNSTSKVILLDAKRPTPKEEEKPKGVVGDAREAEVLHVPDGVKSSPSSENQINAPKVGEEFPSGDLVKNVKQIVEDSLKIMDNDQDVLQNEDGNVKELVEDRVKASQANSDNKVKVFEDLRTKLEVTLQAENIQPVESNLEEMQVVEANAPDGKASVSDSQYVQAAPPIIKTRGETAEEIQEKSSYFGSLVPAKDAPAGSPNTKKVFYVGDNINLPLKMFQDSDGVMKLRVDTDALCHCKNQNCTKRHVEERLREALREHGDENSEILPELQLRYSRDNQKDLIDLTGTLQQNKDADSKGEDLMESFMDSLYNHNENSDVFKRSPKIDSSEDNNVEDEKNVEIEKMELENQIEKLNEGIEKFKGKNTELVNKRTVALFKDVEKTKDVDRMITLANNMLVWMKDLAMKNLDS